MVWWTVWLLANMWLIDAGREQWGGAQAGRQAGKGTGRQMSRKGNRQAVTDT